jgi:hypothetical protein
MGWRCVDAATLWLLLLLLVLRVFVAPGAAVGRAS